MIGALLFEGTALTASLVWIDLEMTGLDPEADVIIEIATLLTDDELNIVAQGPELAIHQSEARLAAMDEWNQNTHGASGLIDRVRASKVDHAGAEAATLEFLKAHIEAGVAPLCGNSIWQDRRFLTRYMPQLESYMHYRMIDVSTIKELARRWRPEVADAVHKRNNHTALSDIKESIEELRAYRAAFFANS